MRERLRQVTQRIAEASSRADTEAAAGGGGSSADPATQDEVKRELEALHREKRTLTADILQVLGLRTRAAWPDGTEPGEGPAQQQQQQQQLGAAAISGGGRLGMAGGVGIERGFPPPDRARTFDHTTAVGGGGGRGGVALEGGAAGLPRLLEAGNPEARAQLSSPPMQTPATSQQQQQQQQQRQPWESMDLAHMARVAASGGGGGGSASASGGASGRSFATGMNIASVEEPTSAAAPSAERSLFALPSSFPPLSGLDRASGGGGGGSGSQYQDIATAAASDVHGRAPAYRDHRRRSSSTTQSQWSSYPGAGPPLKDPWLEGTRSRDRRFSLGGGIGGEESGGLIDANPYQQQQQQQQQLHSSSSQARAKQLHSSSSQARAKHGSHPPGGGGVDSLMGIDELSAAVAMTRLSPPPVPASAGWDLGTTASRGDARPRQQLGGGGGAAAGAVGLAGGGRQWPPVGGERRGFYHDDQFSRGGRGGASAAGQQQYRRDESPQQQQERLARLRSSTAAGAGASSLSSSSSQPPLSLGAAAAGSDPGRYGAPSRPLLSGLPDTDRSPYLYLPGLAEVGTTAAGQVPAARGGIGFGLGSGAAGSAAGAAAAAAGYREQPQQRRRAATAATSSAPSSGRGCKEDGCDRRPIYAYKGSKKAAYCARHRLTGMIDTRHPLCKNEQCTRQPSFGMEGDRRASYCAEHKLPAMINVSSRRCQQQGCLRHPNFGFPGDRRASYCSGHRETGMVDIVSRRCREPSCGRRPLYNFDGLRPVCCSQHKSPGMIDVVSTRCQEPGCFCHPSFGYASDKKARRCARHRLENMEGVKGHRQKRRRETRRGLPPGLL
ncbi:unnamed protein product [Ectocarpus sp. 6 AP-2014]